VTRPQLAWSTNFDGGSLGGSDQAAVVKAYGGKMSDSNGELQLTERKREALTSLHLLETSGLVWLAVHGSLCLALRHPGFTGEARDMVLNFTKTLGQALVDCGALTEQDLALVEQVEQQENPHGFTEERC
jgi:hypothetical protein